MYAEESWDYKRVILKFINSLIRTIKNSFKLHLQVPISTRSAPSLAMFLSGVAFLLVLAIVPRWRGPSQSDGTTFIMSKNTKGNDPPVSYLFCTISLLQFSAWVENDVGIFQIWEEAFKHLSSHIPMLPCERRGSCYYWPVQVSSLFLYLRTCESRVWLPCTFKFLNSMYVYVKTNIHGLLY